MARCKLVFRFACMRLVHTNNGILSCLSTRYKDFGIGSIAERSVMFGSPLDAEKNS